jgi:hypothetical protein
MELWGHYWPNDCIDGSAGRLAREESCSLETSNEKEVKTQKSVQIQNLSIYYSPEPFSNVLSERLGASSVLCPTLFGGVSI